MDFPAWQVPLRQFRGHPHIPRQRWLRWLHVARIQWQWSCDVVGVGMRFTTRSQEYRFHQIPLSLYIYTYICMYRFSQPQTNKKPNDRKGEKPPPVLRFVALGKPDYTRSAMTAPALGFDAQAIESHTSIENHRRLGQVASSVNSHFPLTLGGLPAKFWVDQYLWDDCVVFVHPDIAIWMVEQQADSEKDFTSWGIRSHFYPQIWSPFPAKNAASGARMFALHQLHGDCATG